MLEFVGLAILIMIPIAYVVIVIVKIHAASSAAVTAAREAGRAYVTADTTAQASVRARQAARMALEDQGAPAPELAVHCLRGPCLAPGTSVHVLVTARVALPFVPHDGSRGTIAVAADHEERLDPYRGSV